MNEHLTTHQFSLSFLAATTIAFAAFAAGYAKMEIFGGVAAFLSVWFASLGGLCVYASFSESTAEKLILNSVGLLSLCAGGGILVYTLYCS